MLDLKFNFCAVFSDVEIISMSNTHVISKTFAPIFHKLKFFLCTANTYFT